MSKFKVGDKVKVISDCITNDIYKIYDIEIRDGVNFYSLGGYNIYTDDDLELYKTPHQELLDLGWELHKKLRGARYYRKGDYFIYINTNEKSYKIDSNNCEDVPNITLQLAKILVRYLEELEC